MEALGGARLARQGLRLPCLKPARRAGAVAARAGGGSGGERAVDALSRVLGGEEAAEGAPRPDRSAVAPVRKSSYVRLDEEVVVEDGLSNFWEDASQFKAIVVFSAVLLAFFSLGNIGGALILNGVYGADPAQTLCWQAVLAGLPCQ